MNPWIKGTTSIIVCELTGLLSIPFTNASISTWYAFLTKPPFTPPNWVFGPVWTLLYFLMGIALFLIWHTKTTAKNKHQKQIAISLFFVQLLLNFLWSFIFFYLKQPFTAVIEIVMLWIAIVYTIVLFRKFSVTAAWLLIPYLIWVSFASYLTLAIWLVNR